MNMISLDNERVQSSWIEDVDYSGNVVIITLKSGRQYTTEVRDEDEAQKAAEEIANANSVGEYVYLFWAMRR